MTGRLSGWDAETLAEVILREDGGFPYVDTAFPRSNNQVKGGTVDEEKRHDFFGLFDHIALTGEGEVWLIQTKTNPKDALEWREEIEERAEEDPFGADKRLVIECWLYRHSRPGFDRWRWTGRTGRRWDYLELPDQLGHVVENPKQRIDRADISIDQEARS